MEGHSEVLANLLDRGGLGLFDQVLREVELEQVKQICGVASEDVDAVPQRLRAEVRLMGVGPVEEDDPGTVGRALYSLTR